MNNNGLFGSFEEPCQLRQVEYATNEVMPCKYNGLLWEAP